MGGMQFEYQIIGGDFANAGVAASGTKKVLRQLNVDSKIIKRIVVALYEAEVNVVAHSYGGTVYLDISTDKIFIKLVDNGPGIEDIDKAMQEGFSTASSKVREMGFGAGMGLPNIRKNADELKVESVVGKGTTVTIKVNLNKNE